MAYYFNNIIREHVSVFGSLFNNLFVNFLDESDNLVREVKVPISYTNKDKFIQMYMTRGDDPDNYRDNVMLSLPRLGFEIIDLNYNSEQKLNRLNKFVGYRNNKEISLNADTSIQSADTNIDNFTTNFVYSIYTPVPYKIRFNLYLISTKDIDSMQVLEQIIPMFTPHVMVPTNYNLEEDVKINFDEAVTLENVTREIENNNDYTIITKIIHTFTFSMDIKFFKREEKEDVNRIIKHITFKTGILGEEVVETVDFAAAPMPDKIIVNIDKWYDYFYNYMYHDLTGKEDYQILEKWY